MIFGGYSHSMVGFNCTKKPTAQSVIQLILRWWEEPVEVEWQIVELLVPAVPAKCPEPSPPRHPTVLSSVPHIQRVV